MPALYIRKPRFFDMTPLALFKKIATFKNGLNPPSNISHAEKTKFYHAGASDPEFLRDAATTSTIEELVEKVKKRKNRFHEKSSAIAVANMPKAKKFSLANPSKQVHEQELTYEGPRSLDDAKDRNTGKSSSGEISQQTRQAQTPGQNIPATGRPVVEPRPEPSPQDMDPILGGPDRKLTKLPDAKTSSFENELDPQKTGTGKGYNFQGEADTKRSLGASGEQEFRDYINSFRRIDKQKNTNYAYLLQLALLEGDKVDIDKVKKVLAQGGYSASKIPIIASHFDDDWVSKVGERRKFEREYYANTPFTHGWNDPTDQFKELLYEMFNTKRPITPQQQKKFLELYGQNSANQATINDNKNLQALATSILKEQNSASPTKNAITFPPELATLSLEQATYGIEGKSGFKAAEILAHPKEGDEYLKQLGTFSSANPGVIKPTEKPQAEPYGIGSPNNPLPVPNYMPSGPGQPNNPEYAQNPYYRWEQINNAGKGIPSKLKSDVRKYVNDVELFNGQLLPEYTYEGKRRTYAERQIPEKSATASGSASGSATTAQLDAQNPPDDKEPESSTTTQTTPISSAKSADLNAGQVLPGPDGDPLPERAFSELQNNPTLRYEAHMVGTNEATALLADTKEEAEDAHYMWNSFQTEVTTFPDHYEKVNKVQQWWDDEQHQRFSGITDNAAQEALREKDIYFRDNFRPASLNLPVYSQSTASKRRREYLDVAVQGNKKAKAQWSEQQGVAPFYKLRATVGDEIPVGYNSQWGNVNADNLAMTGERLWDKFQNVNPSSSEELQNPLVYLDNSRQTMASLWQ